MTNNDAQEKPTAKTEEPKSWGQAHAMLTEQIEALHGRIDDLDRDGEVAAVAAIRTDITRLTERLDQLEALHRAPPMGGRELKTERAAHGTEVPPGADPAAESAAKTP